MEPYDSYEHAGVMVEIVRDDDPTSPQDNDNAGTLYSWARWFKGDEQIGEPDLEVLCPICLGEGRVPTRYWPGEDWDDCLRCKGDGTVPAGYGEWFAEHYDAALTIPLYFSEHAGGARLYVDEDDPNCALVFTQKEIDYEWSGHLDPHLVEMKNADGSLTGEVRDFVSTLDEVETGRYYVEPIAGEVLGSCGGFIGEPDAEWICEEANGMAEDAAEGLRKEAQEAAEWAARGVVTI